MKAFFTSISYVFHPLFLPLIGLYFLFEMPTKSPGLIDTSLHNLLPDVKYALYLLIGFLTLVAPLISIFIMYRNKLISSFEMKEKSERILPLVTVLIYYILTYFFLRLKIPPHMEIPFMFPFILGICLNALVALIMTFYFKISLHMIAFFGIAGAITGYLQNQLEYNIWFLLFLIVVGGVVGSARLYLRAHTLKEIVYGIGFGFGIQYFCMKFEWFI